MNTDSWLCGVCYQTHASCFCQCQGRECFLCETCFPIHYAKNPRLVHIAIPIAAYRQHRTPGYFDRLQARSMNVSIGKTELLKNIEEVDKCIAEVSGEIQQVINAVWEYGNSIIAELQQVKAELERDINASIAEVESTIHEDDPFLESSWAVSLRQFSACADQSVFQLFTYSFTPIADMPSLYPVCSYSVNRPQRTIPLLPAIYRSTLRVHDLKTHTYTQFCLAQAFTDRLRLCPIDCEKALCIEGGLILQGNAYILSLSTAELARVHSMFAARAAPGLIKHTDFVYVFGGLRLKSSEKYHILTQSWSRLPDMSSDRSHFSPCILNGDIYLPTAKKLLEVLRLPSETISILNVSFEQLSDSSISIAIADEIVMLTCANEVGRWRVGTDTVTVAKFTNRGDLPNSQCSPVAIEREVFFVRWETGALNGFNLDSSVLTKREYNST